MIGFGIRLATVSALVVCAQAACAEISSISQINAGQKGTTVTLAGTAAGWKDSWKTSAPNTFFLTDATGSIRVCIWPDDLAEAMPGVADRLKLKGTPITLKGEVEVFRDKPEIHVKDGSSVSILHAPGNAAVPGARATTSTVGTPLQAVPAPR